jgi:asparagine synthase (glutamine-hydrolysing)
MVFTRLHVRGVAWSERTYARYGLGFADPFSDRRLVELVLALPPALVNRPGDQSKPLMRAAMRGIVPEAARLGADKILPLPLYLQGLQRRATLISDLLRAPQIADRGWVDGPALRRHWESHLGGGDLRPEFWRALVIEVWLRAHWNRG